MCKGLGSLGLFVFMRQMIACQYWLHTTGPYSVNPWQVPQLLIDNTLDSTAVEYMYFICNSYMFCLNLYKNTQCSRVSPQHISQEIITYFFCFSLFLAPRLIFCLEPFKTSQWSTMYAVTAAQKHCSECRWPLSSLVSQNMECTVREQGAVLVSAGHQPQLFPLLRHA